MEVRQKVDTYRVIQVHSGCGGEFVRSDNITLTSDPPQYKHECNRCGHEAVFYQSYPYFTTKIQT